MTDPQMKDVSYRHQAVQDVFRQFRFAHLPEPYKTISLYSYHLAEAMVENLDDSPELTHGLRKLLEAKDCFVRAMVDDLEKKSEGTKHG